MSDTTTAAATSLAGRVEAAPSGLKGFDVDTPLPASEAQAFRAKGYDFCVRYVGRTEMRPGCDLTADEAQAILDAGLALMIVQHVLDPGWNPTAELGAQYGANAAAFAKDIGVPAGVNVWCDLECVSPEASADDVIAYCTAWHAAVSAAGYVPGLYVGYDPGLTAGQLYDALPFEHYWGAYNVDGDEVPASRGWQLKQRIGTAGDVDGLTTELYDGDLTITDALGGQVLWLTRSAPAAAATSAE